MERVSSPGAVTLMAAPGSSAARPEICSVGRGDRGRRVGSASGSRIELEGNRLPLTHSKDVIDALGG